MTTRFFWKLAATYLVLLGIALVGTNVYALRALRHDYMRRAFDSLDALARLADAPIPAAHQRDALQDWTRRLARSGARVTVVAPDGIVLADSGEEPSRMENHARRPEIAGAMASGEGRAVRYSHTLGRDLVYLAVARSDADGRRLAVRLALPLRRVEDALGEFRARLGLASLVALLAAGGALLVAVRRFTGRIDRLDQFSRRVAGGDFTPLPLDRGRDEIAALGRTLNETAARLDGTIRTLTAERNQSSAILRSMVEGVAVIGPDRSVLYCNPAFAAALAKTQQACVGQPAVVVIRASDLLGLVESALERGTSVQADVVTGTVRTRTFVATAAPIRADGGAAGAVLVLHDITEIRRLERARRDFVANVSHEFRTPLAAIQGFAETLLAGAVDDAQNRIRFLEIIRDQSIRLERLTTDLLKLAEIEGGELALEVRPLSWREVATPAVEALRPRAAGKGIEVVIEAPGEVPTVEADPVALEHILQNLLDNALRYTPSGGRITLGARADAAETVLSVSDTGIGIPRSEQTRIFERFYRVDPARSRALGGTGLGLSIVKHLVDAHGGRIEVDSDLGRGTTFRVHLPRRTAESAAR